MHLRPRTRVVLAAASAVGLVIFLWPLVLRTEAVAVDHVPIALSVVLVMVLGVLLVAITDGGIGVKAVALLGLLAAVGAVLRPLAAGTAGIETVFLPLVLGGRVLGPGFGFVLGSTTLFASALLTGGVGPWLPYQMLAASWVAMGAGLLPGRVRGRREILMLMGYAVVASVVYGLAMNFSFWPFQLGLGTDLSYVPGAPAAENLQRFALFALATSVVWEIGRALTTAAGVALVGRAVLATLRRGATRAGFRPARAASPPSSPRAPRNPQPRYRPVTPSGSQTPSSPRTPSSPAIPNVPDTPDTPSARDSRGREPHHRAEGAHGS